MKAFHNDSNIQTKYLNRIYAHAKADNFIKGQYWENGKGCAVGCTIESSNHKDYETELGIPEWIARLEDTLFENLPNDLAMTWPVRFLESVNLGSNLDSIKVPFIVYLMEENLKSIRNVKYDVDNNPDVKTAIDLTESALLQMIVAQKSGNPTLILAAESVAWSAESVAWSAESAESAAWSAAESAAWSARLAAWSAESVARLAAWSAAESAAWSAAWSAARSAAWSAAWSAARSARLAAWSAAESAAWSAAWSAARSARLAAESVAWSAESAARSAAESDVFVNYSEKLLQLIKDCK